MQPSKLGSAATGVGRAPRARPPGLLCETCFKRDLRQRADGGSPQTAFHELADNDIHVFQLKLRDWLGVERVELRPCLSRCPETGVTVERRGKQMVLGREEIDLVNKQFDPTRQLSFFGPEADPT